MIAGRHPQALALAGRIVQSAEADERHGTLIQALVLGAKAGGGAGVAGPRPPACRAGRLSAGFIDEAPAAKVVVAQDLIEPLTEREMGALRLLACLPVC